MFESVLSGERMWHIEQGNCLGILPSIPNGSIDAVITDPPYPEIDRDYGRMTESAWMEMMKEVVFWSRKVLKSTGSAVFVLQANSEKVGRMRSWLWDFQSWLATEWNIVQDFYWWNPTAPPTVHCQRTNGLMRPSVKACVWAGEPDCFRSQESVLWGESDANAASDRGDRLLRNMPGGLSIRRGRACGVADERGGVTPFNCLPISNADSTNSGGASGHGAATAFHLCDWLTRYIVPIGGIVLDPFAGSGTTGISALRRGCRYIGIEKETLYAAMARKRIEKDSPLFNREIL